MYSIEIFANLRKIFVVRCNMAFESEVSRYPRHIVIIFAFGFAPTRAYAKGATFGIAHRITLTYPISFRRDGPHWFELIHSRVSHSLTPQTPLSTTWPYADETPDAMQLTRDKKK